MNQKNFTFHYLFFVKKRQNFHFVFKINSIFLYFILLLEMSKCIENWNFSFDLIRLLYNNNSYFFLIYVLGHELVDFFKIFFLVFQFHIVIRPTKTFSIFILNNNYCNKIKAFHSFFFVYWEAEREGLNDREKEKSWIFG